MEIMLLVVYMTILFYIITFLVISMKKKSKRYWVVEYISEVLAIIGAIVTMCYFNDLPLPQDALFPGLEYLAEILFSMGAIVLYIIVFMVSIICGITAFLKEKT